jgi:hypothetical protein
MRPSSRSSTSPISRTRPRLPRSGAIISTGCRTCPAPAAGRDVAHAPVVASFAQRAKLGTLRAAPTGAGADKKQVAVLQLINAYRFLGNRWAQLDPLKRTERPAIQELDPAFYGFTEADLGQSFATGSFRRRARAGHAARDPRGAAPDLLRHHRRRVHVPLGCGAEALDPGQAGDQSARRQPGAPRTSAASCAWSPRPRRWSATCTPATSARSASRWRAASR